MAPRFLNERLVTTPRFAPGERGAGAREQETRTSEETARTAPAPDVDQLVRTEHAEIRKAALREDWAEINRLPKEMSERLRNAIGTLEQEQNRVSARLDEFRRHLAAMDALADTPAAEESPQALRERKMLIRGVHMELLKFERESTVDTGQKHLLQSLTFGDLTRLGWGLAWPVVLGLLLAAAVIVVGILVAMGA